MRIAIIEDEPHTANDLAACIRKADPAAEMIAILPSVKEAVAFLREDQQPDLIFSDIQLGDGLSFSVFETISNRTPVIFCTAYDEYALRAFKATGIDYILKPFTVKTIAASLKKFRSLKAAPYAPALSDMLTTRPRSVLVYYKEKITPVNVNDVALFYLQNELMHLITFDRQHHIVNYTMEDLQKETGALFYRANRQFLVSRTAIKDISQYLGRKLLINLTIPFDEKITVGKVKASHFLDWLAST